jgi:hypothetical protein
MRRVCGRRLLVCLYRCQNLFPLRLLVCVPRLPVLPLPLGPRLRVWHGPPRLGQHLQWRWVRCGRACCWPGLPPLLLACGRQDLRWPVPD